MVDYFRAAMRDNRGVHAVGVCGYELWCRYTVREIWPTIPGQLCVIIGACMLLGGVVTS